MPEKFYFECNGKLMSSSESDNNRDKTIIRNESTLSEIYYIFEMLIFGTKNKAIKLRPMGCKRIRGYLLTLMY